MNQYSRNVFNGNEGSTEERENVFIYTKLSIVTTVNLCENFFHIIQRISCGSFECVISGVLCNEDAFLSFILESSHYSYIEFIL